jgi:hypothetical protein
VRLSRLLTQPLTPPDTNDALRRSVEDRVKMRFLPAGSCLLAFGDL